MDFATVQTLYELSRDETADPKDRSDAAEHLASHEAEIIEGCLNLPEMKREDESLRFPDYARLRNRNILDAGHKWNPKFDEYGGRFEADLLTIPAEDDRIGNCIFRVIARQKAHEQESKKLTTV
jgi:hypothetical protein